MSKPVTSVAALALLDEGRFTLDEPITRWAPEFAALRVLRSPNGALTDTEPAARPITFGDLLTHRAGLTYGDFWSGPIAAVHAEALGGDIDTRLTPDQWLAALAAIPLIAQPGAVFHYSHATDVLGVLLARMEGTYLAFARLFMGDGAVDGVRILDPDTVALMTRDHSPTSSEPAPPCSACRCSARVMASVWAWPWCAIR